MAMKKEVIEQKVRSMYHDMKEGIENILKENLGECYNKVKESPKYDYYIDSLAESALKFKLYVEREFSPVKYNREQIVESARQSDYLSSRIISTKIAGLIETYVIGKSNKLLEAYTSNELDDVGLTFQKTLFQSKVDILEALIKEACNRKKKKSKKK